MRRFNFILLPVASGMLLSTMFPLGASGAAPDKAQVFVTLGSADFREDVSPEAIKLFHKKCPAVDLTIRQDKADYIVGVSDDGSGDYRKGRRAVVSTSEGTVVMANSARNLSSVVKEACVAIAKEWSSKARPARQNIDDLQGEKQALAIIQQFSAEHSDFDALQDRILELLQTPGILGDTSSMSQRQKLQVAYDFAVKEATTRGKK